jgi:serine/threonine protein kinase
MEYCPLTLRKVLSILYPESANYSNIDPQIKRYIASELFLEILKGVSYLHSNKKHQVIHRDLKPENILISYGENGSFVRIADFGLATFHEFSDQSHTQNRGTGEYRAPEVRTKKYDTKADLYSLGIIASELFNIDLEDPHARYFKSRKIFGLYF